MISSVGWYYGKVCNLFNQEISLIKNYESMHSQTCLNIMILLAVQQNNLLLFNNDFISWLHITEQIYYCIHEKRTHTKQQKIY